MKTAQVTLVPHAIDRRRLVVGLSGLATAVGLSQDATAKSSRSAQGAALSYPVTYHRTKTVDGISIFYREAGPKDAPVVLLLHGFPTSSHMFRNLPALADRYHVIAFTPALTKNAPERNLQTSFQLILITRHSPNELWNGVNDIQTETFSTCLLWLNHVDSTMSVLCPLSPR